MEKAFKPTPPPSQTSLDIGQKLSRNSLKHEIQRYYNQKQEKYLAQPQALLFLLLLRILVGIPPASQINQFAWGFSTSLQ